jgi:hypothetical protein
MKLWKESRPASTAKKRAGDLRFPLTWVGREISIDVDVSLFSFGISLVKDTPVPLSPL